MTITHLLNVDRHDTQNRALVTLAGEIDLDSAPLVRESLARCLRDGIRVIDVDVTAVTFCDCSGLNTFLHALLNATAVGGSLHLHFPSPALERLFALTGSSSLPHPSRRPLREPTGPAASCDARDRTPARSAPGRSPGRTAVTALRDPQDHQMRCAR
ncbi:STAS domain-containing protein [Streptomyces beijiangensis]|uniref:Anti-sigma factor antagonist n=2 Tax=Streptomyces beijiangensis TaxID=163361 RepID=A0A939JFE8_9ACTN|nr:STAS domain-containing protein [Streptomyces beijiangensis]MBO0510437.1 STAS domain-containing protein [Streptomyces beijiangensis]